MASNGGLPRESLEAIIKRTPFAVWIGAKLERYEPGVVELGLPLRPELTMHQGFVHGAVIGFVADSACAWAAASIAGEVVTAEYKANLLAPAIGERLIGRGEVIQASPRQVVCRADVHAVRSNTPHLVATALATISVFEPRRAALSN
jgi:uncharacterized protein (TIGR00369 family)